MVRGLIGRVARLLGAGALVLTLAACGGGGGDCVDAFGGSACGGDAGGGGGGGGTTVDPVLALEVRLLDASGQATTTVALGQPVRAEAVLRLDGATVSDEIVQFSVEQSAQLVRIDPVTGSQLTDSSGRAGVAVTSLGVATGAGRITASASVGDAVAVGSANFFTTGTSSPQPSTLTLGAVEVGSAAVSAYGTTGVRVVVRQDGQPYTADPVEVRFSTSCPAGKATITASANTQPDGSAVATFVDNGCAQTADTAVTITAAIGTDSESGSLLVRSPTTGSLRFVSADPSDKSITLRGQGGNGRQENATLTFRLVDVAGQGVADADVCFDATTYVGGLNVDGFGPGRLPNPQGATALCGTDNLSVVRYVKRTNPDGTVTVQVNSGTVPTPVRVRARALYPSGAAVPLESYSDTLSVSTGLPLQRSMSLSVDQANIDGGNFDGEIARLTVRLADQFSNPVPDGTVVNFIGSGAAVCTSDNGSCRTTNGACSCDVVSQERRPADNRVIVTAYAVGLEDFDDRNGDNLFTPGVDPFYDLGDAFVDANKDGIVNSQTINGDTDILIPYQQPNVYKATGDGVRGTAHIRASTVIYLSQSSSAGDPTAVVPLSSLSESRDLVSGARLGGYFVRLRPFCPEGTVLPQAGVQFQLDDGIGNPMAAGTRLEVIDPSDNVSTGGFRPGTVLAAGSRPPSPLIDLPNVPKALAWTSLDAFGTVPTGHGLTVRGVQDKCSGDGSLSMQVTSPRGGAAVARVLYEGEPRTGGRGTLNVRYADIVEFAPSVSGSTVTLNPGSWVGPAGGPAASSVRVNWGDGSPEEDVTATSSHDYAGSGSRTITVRVTAGGSTYVGTETVSIP